MFIKQLSVVLKNTPGRLAVLSEILGKEGVNIRAISVADTSEVSTVRFVVDDPTTIAIKKKLTEPPLDSKLDITITTREKDGKEVIYIPRTKKNDYAFLHLIVIDPTEDTVSIPASVPEPAPEPVREELNLDEEDRGIYEEPESDIDDEEYPPYDPEVEK